MLERINFPWAGVAVVAAFVSTSLLAPQMFDPLRPPEQERAQPARLADPEVDARLWEDPFVAAQRYEAERIERCDKPPSKAQTTPTDCDAIALQLRRAPDQLTKLLDKDGDQDRSDTLVIAALAPGNAFVGAQENRRRTRYALLAGLQAKGYLPDHAEHLGLLRFDLRSSLLPAGVNHELQVPYETLSERPLLRGDAPKNGKGRGYARVALVWIDEAALPAPKLDALARVLNELVGEKPGQPRLAVIGPSSSDAMRVALADLRQASQRGFTLEPEVRAGYALLAEADIFNAAATAPDHQLEELNRQKLERFLGEKLALIEGGAGARPIEVNFRRTIATDSAVVRSLVHELRLRLSPSDQRRVVLVAERDSLYAQALVSELRFQMRDAPKLSFEVAYFFRGIDGATARDTVREASAANHDKLDDAAIEWPETRGQLDYLRRLAQRLADSEATPGQDPIGAIGILGSDVHDKLLVMQALRGSFPDKVFFTTDMDARYVHPHTLRFTRNLVVASSLPLAFAEPSQPGPGVVMRDVYQSATYLAARRAACREDDCRKAEDQWTDRALANPSVYEIGRNRAVPLGGYDAERQVRQADVPRAVVAFVSLAALAFMMLAWPSTAALRRARTCFWPAPATPAATASIDRSTALLVALHCALLAYTVGSMVEFVNPGRLSLNGILIAIGLVAIAALLALHPHSCAIRSTTGPAGPATPDAVAGSPRRGAVLWVGLTIAALGALVLWMIWPATSPQRCTECEPAVWLEGVSAWPSHLIHLLALVVTLGSLDRLWFEGRRSIRGDSAWLGMPVARERALSEVGPRRGPLFWVAQNSLARWQCDAGSVCFARLWRQYVHRGRGGARVMRIAFWYVVTVISVAVLFVAFSDGYVPEVPVRGAEHRRLVSWTLYALLLLLPLLVVAVADATMLACRFIWHLNGAGIQGSRDGERTLYPAETVARFARSLGGEHHELWIKPIAADPAARGARTSPEHQAGAHSLLDDWIDVQLVGRRTRHVGPLILGPFIVLALLVVARSRLFDSWALTVPVVLAACGYLVWLVVLAFLLKQAAEQTRRCALARMNADLRWLGGSNRAELVGPFKQLISAVETNRTGALAPFLEQPLFRALLVPLGGAGGAQLLDALLLAR